MFIGYFTERPYQDPKAKFFGASKDELTDLVLSNGEYDSEIAADLYNRYFDEKLYAEEMGFDGLMLNEHHSTPFTMGSVMNVEASILARITKRAKIVLLGNILPVRSDPIFLAEELAMIDVISRGRLISGWVRGTGRESLSHNAQSPYNWERFQEAHELIIKTWTDPGPFRWEGRHYQMRYVNPWAKPYQKPHMPIWVPGVLSYNTLEWAARKRYPYLMTATDEEPTKECFGIYESIARDNGYEAGPQNYGYMLKLHVDETDELAEATARKLLQGPSNPFLEGNQGGVHPHLQALPGLTSRKNMLPTASSRAALAGRGISTTGFTPGSFEDQVAKRGIIYGTPKTVLKQLRIAMEKMRPGIVMMWDGDGAMTHDDAMRSLRLMGEVVVPTMREWAAELELPGPTEVDPATGKHIGTATTGAAAG
ncbi:MAG: LLM class flavin-dependent oxidoreductase [Chloroflexi bacterium]|nr:LLM class flavin-dependent oxidoreductase [Chloroflexota bacterium]